MLKWFLTRSEGEAELLGLDLSDFLWFQFAWSLSAICHLFVLKDRLSSTRVLDQFLCTSPFQQRLQLIAP